MAKLAMAIHVTDPESGRRLVLEPGEEPAPHLAALITNPAAWEDGKLPDQDDAHNAGNDNPPSDTEHADAGEPEDTKPAAKKTAARTPARGRKAADEGTSGQ